MRSIGNAILTRDLVERAWSSKQEALNFIASLRKQDFKLVVGFDPFSQDRYVKALAQRNYCTHERFRLPAIQLVDEASIKFDFVEGERTQCF
jgi:hypothetical protein